MAARVTLGHCNTLCSRPDRERPGSALRVLGCPRSAAAAARVLDGRVVCHCGRPEPGGASAGVPQRPHLGPEPPAEGQQVSHPHAHLYVGGWGPPELGPDGRRSIYRGRQTRCGLYLHSVPHWVARRSVCGATYHSKGDFNRAVQRVAFRAVQLCLFIHKMIDTLLQGVGQAHHGARKQAQGWQRCLESSPEDQRSVPRPGSRPCD